MDTEQLIETVAAAPVVSAAPVAAEKPFQPAFVDDAVRLEEAEEEARRREAYEGEYIWKGQALRAFTPSICGLWERLCAVDVPLPPEGNYSSLEAFAPNAAKLLFLLTHPPEEWQHLRARPLAFVQHIEAWWDEACGWSEIIPAASLAVRVINDGKRNMVEAKPSGRAGSLGE